mmetsp:Transcript_12563/g.17247  ORF Transcript_12563/g.17247 Transcript_12563/m.17247 type:complete len:408 (-) Transcript_12563:897-2120(-)
MLTRRQSWRRTKPPIRRKHHSSETTEEDHHEKIFDNKKNQILRKEESNSAFQNISSPISTRESSLSEISSVRSDARSIRSESPSQSSIYSHGSFTLSEIDSPSVMEQNHISKAVNFCSTVRVCLVPSRKCLAPFSDELFWSPDDYKRFKNEAIQEIRAILDTRNKEGGSFTPREAKNVLYQPTSPVSRISHRTPIPSVIVQNKSLLLPPPIDTVDEIVSFHPFPTLAIPTPKGGSPIRIRKETSMLDTTSEFDNDLFIDPSEEYNPINENEIDETLSLLTEEDLHNLNEDAPNRIMRRVDSVALFKQQGISSSSIPVISLNNNNSLTDFLNKNDIKTTSIKVDHPNFHSNHQNNHLNNNLNIHIDSNEVIVNQRWRKKTPFVNSTSNPSSSSPRMQMDLSAIPAVLV